MEGEERGVPSDASVDKGSGVGGLWVCIPASHGLALHDQRSWKSKGEKAGPWKVLTVCGMAREPGS